MPGRLPGRRGASDAACCAARPRWSRRASTRRARRCAAAGSPLPGVVVPPGVDVERFRPLDADDGAKARASFGLDPHVPLVVGVSRLVPRKGFDVLIDAMAGIPACDLAIGGAGRDRPGSSGAPRRRGLARPRALPRARPRPSTSRICSACGDVFAMPCRDRWGGLEAEGFGIVFLEAAAAGVPVVAGRSGGSHEAVATGITGEVVDGRSRRCAVRGAVSGLLDAATRRASAMGAAARGRAVREFSLRPARSSAWRRSHAATSAGIGMLT